MSSHGRESKFMEVAMVEKVGVGCTAVSGGGCDEVWEVVARKWGQMAAVKGIVLQVGGNDIAVKKDGVQVPGLGYAAMREKLEELVRWLRERVGGWWSPWMRCHAGVWEGFLMWW